MSVLINRPIVAAVLVAAAFALAACGRAGPLELPPGPAAGTPPPAPASTVAGGQAGQDSGQKTGFDANGNPIAPPGQKKSFPLDPLLQ